MSQKQKRLEANSLVIKDSKGKAMITMGVFESKGRSYPNIELYDGVNDQPLIRIEIDGVGPFISINHEDGTVAANLRHFKDGRTVCGVYGDGEDDHRSAVTLIDMNGEPCLEDSLRFSASLRLCVNVA